MYKAIYLRPNISLIPFNSFVENFIKRFCLRRILNEDQVYYLENEDMTVKIQPDVAEILMYDGQNRKAIREIRNYFKS
jgi:hypothetical protein